MLGIEHATADLVFELEALLTPDHGEYQAPPPNEWACFRRARLTVSSDHPITLIRPEALPTVDPDGTADYGNIDLFHVVSQDPDGTLTWEIVGDWGHAVVADPAASLVVCR